MAFIRGDLYAWADTEGLHIWQVAPPNDGMMRHSIWAKDRPEGVTLAAVYIPNATMRKIVKGLAANDWADTAEGEGD